LFLFCFADALVENNFESYRDSKKRWETEKETETETERRNAGDLFIFIVLDSVATWTRGSRRRNGEWKWAYKWPADKLDTS